MKLEEVLVEWNKIKGLTMPPKEPVRLWSAESRTLYVENEWGPAVPYPPVEHADGTKNHGYRRLKANLSAIASIPEVHEWPELQHFLEIVNIATSPIESVGCEKHFFPVDGQGDAKIKLGSYADFIFTDMPLNEQPEKLIALAVCLIDSVKGCDQWWACVEIGLQRFRHLPGINNPWGLMLRVNNYARNEQEARHFWGETILRLGQCVAGLPRNFGKQEG